MVVIIISSREHQFSKDNLIFLQKYIQWSRYAVVIRRLEWIKPYLNSIVTKNTSSLCECPEPPEASSRCYTHGHNKNKLIEDSRLQLILLSKKVLYWVHWMYFHRYFHCSYPPCASLSQFPKLQWVPTKYCVLNIRGRGALIFTTTCGIIYKRKNSLSVVAQEADTGHGI